jgi:hypothetical protein
MSEQNETATEARPKLKNSERCHYAHVPHGRGTHSGVEPVMRCYKMQCCDCGLIHEMEFNIATTDNGVPMAEPRVEFRMRRVSAPEARESGTSSADGALTTTEVRREQV